MNRKEYLIRCQKYSVLPNGILYKKACDVPNDVAVEVKGCLRYPYAYQLSFDNKGSAWHTAILIDPKSGSLIYSNLKDVQEVKGE